jgi:hypothetical protein
VPAASGQSCGQLKQVPGIGEKKADVYGAEILQALRNFGEGARAAPTVAKEPAPAEQTLRLLNEGRSFEEIAAFGRGRFRRSFARWRT